MNTSLAAEYECLHQSRQEYLQQAPHPSFQGNAQFPQSHETPVLQQYLQRASPWYILQTPPNQWRSLHARSVLLH